MLNTKYILYGFAISIITFGSINAPQAFARHHHKDGPPPPVTEKQKDDHLNPQQSPDDISHFSKQAAENAQPQKDTHKKQDGAPALLPGHYTKRSSKINGGQGWVNSKRQTGKYDMGINMPVPHTADPTQNKTKGVFRRAMPVYEPNY